MKGSEYRMAIVYASILLLGVISITACISAEIKRTKAKDVKLDGTLCSLPGSPAFGLGIAASICVFTAQVIGTSAIGCHLCSGENKKRRISTRRDAMAIILFILSWITFGFSIILLGVATSMNQRQQYGRGWLKGECYVVKDGVYIGAAVLVLVTVVFILSCTCTARMRRHSTIVQGEQGRRVQGENRVARETFDKQ